MVYVLLLMCFDMCVVYVGCNIVICVIRLYVCIFFFKQKTAYEMRISDWSSDVCSSDLRSRCSPRMVWKVQFAAQVDEANATNGQRSHRSRVKLHPNAGDRKSVV